MKACNEKIGELRTALRITKKELKHKNELKWSKHSFVGGMMSSRPLLWDYLDKDFLCDCSSNTSLLEPLREFCAKNPLIKRHSVNEFAVKGDLMSCLLDEPTILIKSSTFFIFPDKSVVKASSIAPKSFWNYHNLDTFSKWYNIKLHHNALAKAEKEYTKCDENFIHKYASPWSKHRQVPISSKNHTDIHELEKHIKNTLDRWQNDKNQKEILISRQNAEKAQYARLKGIRSSTIKSLKARLLNRFIEGRSNKKSEHQKHVNSAIHFGEELSVEEFEIESDRKRRVEEVNKEILSDLHCGKLRFSVSQQKSWHSFIEKHKSEEFYDTDEDDCRDHDDKGDHTLSGNFEINSYLSVDSDY